jgi:hypothetical protein
LNEVNPERFVPHKISSVFLLSAILLLGCSKDDDNNSVPPATAPSPVIVSDILRKRPTTESLKSGPRTPLPIKFAPFTLMVPPGWQLMTNNSTDVVAATVEGSTPTDEVVISIPSNAIITTEQEKSLESRAQQDFKKYPDLLEKPGIREITGGKVIERLIPDVQSATEPSAAAPLQMMQWTFTVCIPAATGKSFDAYELRFLGMTIKQYKADQAFLRVVIDSLTYTPDTLPN